MVDLGAIIRAWRCRRWDAALVDYAEGRFTANERTRIERHLASCARCAAAAAALTDVPASLRNASVARDESFWVAQRQATMRAINATRAVQQELEERRGVGFDLRLALPVAVAAVIAVAGYLSLRPPTQPGEMALGTLSLEDLTVLSELTEETVGPPDSAVGLRVDADSAAAGAIDAGWVGANDVFGWGELDDKDLDTLNAIVG